MADETKPRTIRISDSEVDTLRQFIIAKNGHYWGKGSPGVITRRSIDLLLRFIKTGDFKV